MRETNDRIRTSGDFGPGTDNPLLVTPGVEHLGPSIINTACLQCMAFDAFDDAQTPHHDFGSVSIEKTEIWFKIDPHPERQDRRVFTFLLPEEY